MNYPPAPVPGDADKKVVAEAFAAAIEAGQPLYLCYAAGVEALSRQHPDYNHVYAAKLATKIILDFRSGLLFGTIM